MKNIIRALVLLVAFIASSAQAGTFGGEKVISTDPDLGAQFPEVAYFNGTIHIVFVGFAPGKLGDIYYSRSTNTGGTWSPPVNLSNNATTRLSNDRPQVTAGPNGVFVGWHTEDLDFGGTGEIYVRRSTNDGVSFGAAEIIAGTAGDGFYARITDLKTDSAGRVHVSYYENRATNGIAGMINHRMNCNGTWGPNVAVTQTKLDGDVDNEQPRVTEVQGKIYLAYRSSRAGNPQGGWPPYTIIVQVGTPTDACSTTWSYPGRRIAGGIPYTFATTHRPEITADANGSVHLAFWDNTAGNNVFYRRATPGTGLFSAPQRVSNFGVDHLEPGGLASTPAAARGGFQVPPALVTNGSTAFIAYQKNERVSNGDFENGAILLRESSDNGSTWGAEQAISTTGQSTTPRMAIGGAGNQNVAIVFSDLRPTARVYFRLYTLGAVSGGSSFDLSPGVQTFANTQVGSASAAVTFTLVNSGGAGSISSIGLSGNYARPTGSAGGTCTTGAFAGGTSCTINLTFSPTALGPRNGTLTVVTDSGTVTSVLRGTGVASSSFTANVNAVVTSYYETILGRSPDQAGLNFWAAEANRVALLGADVREVFYAMSMAFFGSAEYTQRQRTDTQFLTDMYITFFVRDPDAPGLAFWQGELTAVQSRSALLNSFLFSTEFSNLMTSLFGSASVRPEVNMSMDLFRGTFGRLPDSEGFNFWLGEVRRAQCLGVATAVSDKIKEISGLFFNSAEYIGRSRNNRDFVGDVYNTYLRRGPGGDSAGFNFWVGQVGPRGRDGLRDAFITSTEFKNRVDAVIAAGCFGPT